MTYGPPGGPGPYGGAPGYPGPGFPGGGFPGGMPGPGYGMPPVPPPRSYLEIAATVPRPGAESRYAEALASYPMVMATPTIPRPSSTYDASYRQLPQDRFYQFRMWLQSPEGQYYKQWENEARLLLDVIEPFNARWAAGWMAAEAGLLRPIVGYLGAFDSHTRQLLTHADLNPMARNSFFIGHSDPQNPIPYDVLAGRLPERSEVQRKLDEYDDFWRERFGVELGLAWRTSWGPPDLDPQYIAGTLRQIIDAVTDRLWAESELPEIPALPQFAPPVRAVPEAMSSLVEEMAERCGGERIPSHELPASYTSPSHPQQMPSARPRWARATFQLGRAVVVGGRSDTAEAVALEVVAGQQPMAKVQRFDGSIAWFPINDVLGIR
ncbi:hypothetical protein [Epidermidibacterium keratini]|uniref:hypothetical protein n=1 Tax=Epidermidibacterium keratini TaxID=1891644 RepID=UPI0018659A45|nr:hypothetical protein [Epidermidibacterium keratini]